VAAQQRNKSLRLFVKIVYHKIIKKQIYFFQLTKITMSNNNFINSVKFEQEFPPFKG
jgi:hypothetical protein